MTNTTLEQRFDEFLNRDRRSEDFYKSYLWFLESEIARAKEQEEKRFTDIIKNHGIEPFLEKEYDLWHIE